MLRTTPNRRSVRAATAHRYRRQAAVAAVIATGALALAGCGSSSSTTTTALSSSDKAALAAYQKAGNAICAAKLKATAPIDARMEAAEKKDHAPSLADTKALNEALAEEATALSKLSVPAPLAATRQQLTDAMAAYVARAQQLLAQHGNLSIAYDAVDTKLLADSTTVVSKMEALGLNTCK